MESPVLSEGDAYKVLIELQAREQIKELRARYCWYAVRADYEQIAALYVPNCVLSVPIEGKVVTSKGREGIMAYLQSRNLQPLDVIPIVQNHIIKINGEEAWGTCTVFSHAAPPGRVFVGRYHDRFRKLDGEWLFVERHLSYYMPKYDESDRDCYGIAPR